MHSQVSYSPVARLVKPAFQKRFHVRFFVDHVQQNLVPVLQIRDCVEAVWIALATLFARIIVVNSQDDRKPGCTHPGFDPVNTLLVGNACDRAVQTVYAVSINAVYAVQGYCINGGFADVGDFGIRIQAVLFEPPERGRVAIVHALVERLSRVSTAYLHKILFRVDKYNVFMGAFLVQHPFNTYKITQHKDRDSPEIRQIMS